MTDTRERDVVVTIPNMLVAPDDPQTDTEALVEQVVAEALASYGVDHDGLVEANIADQHPDWNQYEACPECGSQRLGETCQTHGTCYAGPTGIESFDADHNAVALYIECANCETMLYDSVVVRP